MMKKFEEYGIKMEMSESEHITKGIEEAHSIEEIQQICDDVLEIIYELFEKQLSETEKEDRLSRIMLYFDFYGRMNYVKGFKQGITIFRTTDEC